VGLAEPAFAGGICTGIVLRDGRVVVQADIYRAGARVYSGESVLGFHRDERPYIAGLAFWDWFSAIDRLRRRSRTLDQFDEYMQTVDTVETPTFDPPARVDDADPPVVEAVLSLTAAAAAPPAHLVLCSSEASRA
jgi:hypothetical protein